MNRNRKWRRVNDNSYDDYKVYINMTHYKLCAYNIANNVQDVV